MSGKTVSKTHHHVVGMIPRNQDFGGGGLFRAPEIEETRRKGSSRRL